ncbi:MAG: toprim domain-containing protein [Magnetococcales bacterium]|nr:toprim domain-containing protein [Magnetococcales bacterium]
MATHPVNGGNPTPGCVEQQPNDSYFDFNNAGQQRQWVVGTRKQAFSDTDRLRDRLQGNWLSALRRVSPVLGLAIDRLGKHVPCPRHGGTDGFRMFPDADATGGALCNSCGSFPDGFSLVRWVNGWDFPTAKQALADAIGFDLSWKEFSPAPCIAPRIEKTGGSTWSQDTEQVWRRLKAIAQRVVPLDHPTAETARRYLFNRGLVDIMRDLPDPAVFGFHPDLDYRYKQNVVMVFPGLVARVQSSNDQTVCLHRTYLSEEGTKASVPEVKKLTSPIYQGAVSGAAIRLYPAGEVLSIAEGIESCFAVRLGTLQPVWSTISAGGMETLQLPTEIRTVNIWCDLDRSGAGQRAAESLARRLTLEGRVVRIMTPPGPIQNECKGLDWLDIWNRERRTS